MKSEFIAFEKWVTAYVCHCERNEVERGNRTRTSMVQNALANRSGAIASLCSQ
jgi:hypothetical protein